MDMNDAHVYVTKNYYIPVYGIKEGRSLIEQVMKHGIVDEHDVWYPPSAVQRIEFFRRKDQ